MVATTETPRLCRTFLRFSCSCSPAGVSCRESGVLRCFELLPFVKAFGFREAGEAEGPFAS